MVDFTALAGRPPRPVQRATAGPLAPPEVCQGAGSAPSAGRRAPITEGRERVQSDNQGETRRCRYCPNPIVLDGRGNWTHKRIGYTCRDEGNVTLGTYAEPQEPWPAITRPGRWHHPPGYLPSPAATQRDDQDLPRGPAGTGQGWTN
jgi:hypothetical protein